MVPVPSGGGGGFVLPHIQGLYPFLNKKFKAFSRTLKDGLRVVPHFSSGIVERAKRERVKITEEKWGTTRSLFKGHISHFSSTRFRARKSLKSMSF